jgi:phage-related protein
MVEFGAKLSLKDNMSAVLQKNLKMQKQFSDQVKRTSNNIKNVGKVVAKPVITIKDSTSKALTKVKNGLKQVGKTVAKPFIKLKDGATKVINKISPALKKIGKIVAKPVIALKDMATKGLSKIKSTLSSLAKGVTIGIGIAGAGVTALAGGAIAEGAKLQQSKGGVETLYKSKEGEGGATDTVIANANKAYQTAGLSANAYMETVTSFSASLISSLGGDTAKSAQVADMAIIDMADNANKFGTDMESIQNAYQGFAKQNYTMLDNLKLGYGGTKEEMQRLLKDAQKITGVKYDISNLSDVYSAIHVIQEDLGVAGATATEASTTFSGSFNAMKASAQNFLGALSTGGDVTGTIQDMVSSASTFLIGNAIPMLANVFKALPGAIVTAVRTSAPKLKEAGGLIVAGLKDAVKGMLPGSMGEAFGSAFDNVTLFLGEAFGEIQAMFGRLAPVITDALGGAFANSGGFVASIGEAFAKALPVVESIIGSLAGVVGTILPVLMNIGSAFADVFPSILTVVDSVISAITPVIGALGGAVQAVLPTITDIIKSFADIIVQVMPTVSDIFTSVVNAVVPIIQTIANTVKSMMPSISTVITTVVNVVQALMPTFTVIFEIIGSVVQKIMGVVQRCMPIISGIFQTVGNIIQTVMPAVEAVISGAWAIIEPIIDIAMSIFNALMDVVDAVFPAIQSTIESVWGFLAPIFEALGKGLSIVGDALKGVAEFVGGGIDAIAGAFGFAYGKDRVPYDNYPAVLHEGEKVLTRNQADQYDRHMSTRGVQLTQITADVPRDTGDTSTVPTPKAPTEAKQDNTRGTTVTIEKLAETVVIEKEADVDKVVEDMIAKFRKLVPNMA